MEKLQFSTSDFVERAFENKNRFAYPRNLCRFSLTTEST